MNVSTFIKRCAFVAVLGVTGLTLNAQTFVYEGLIYKAGTGAKSTELTVQKPGTKVTVGDPTLTAFTGKIRVPAKLTFNGTEYKVVSIGTALKGTDIEEIYIEDGVTTAGRGCLSNCGKLKKVRFPSTLAKFYGNDLQNDSLLEEVNIPANVKAMASACFSNLKSLKRLVIDESSDALDLDAVQFTGSLDKLEYLEINRPIDGKACFGNNQKGENQDLGRNLKSLKTLVLGGKYVSIHANYFENNPALETVTITSPIADMGERCFYGCGFAEFTVPAGVTAIPNNAFRNCPNLKKVVLGDAVTSIGTQAFMSSPVEDINIPATLVSVADMAFSGCNLSGALTFPEGFKSVGVQAFANNKGLTAVNFPATAEAVGDGAFRGCEAIAAYSVAAGNEVLAADGATLTSADKSVLLAVAPASELTALTGDFTELKPNAAFNASKIVSVNLPKCKVWGDYCLAGTSIESLALKGTYGRFIAANCAALKSLSIAGAEVPQGVAYKCAALTGVKFLNPVTTIKPQAFEGCAALQSLDLGNILAIVESDFIKDSGIKNLTLASAVAPATAAGVFAPGSDITLTVPTDLVATYKSETAGEWSYLKIAGDANLAAGPTDLGMPAGLYYAGEDGNLHCVYSDGQSDTYDVGGMPHAFQLLQFKNRIYGASAGKTFTYQNGADSGGDGKLFYISRIGGNTFQATVLDNAGGNAYKDPAGLYIYGDTLYVNDRNVCVRKISANSISLPINYTSWMENNWMSFYGVKWSYGCIKCGWAITKDQDAAGNPEPLYWVGMKYNGNGLYTFKEENVGTSTSNVGKGGTSYLTAISPIYTTFYIDEANKHIYIYMEKCAGDLKAGLYRVNLDDLIAKPEPATFEELNPVLVDGSPLAWEGSGANEHVGISQLSADETGTYLYWCSRKASAKDIENTKNAEYEAGGHYAWAEEYNADEPRHQDCIKRIKLGEAAPAVEIVAKDVRGYGVVPVNFEGSKKPEGGVNDIVVDNEAAKTLTVAGDIITSSVDAVVYIYDMAGNVVESNTVAAGQSFSVAHLADGVYVAAANGQAVKFAK